MKIEVKESVALEDGKHIGIIEKIVYRNEPYKYTDIFISVHYNHLDYQLKYGCPTSSGIKTKLMKLLNKFKEIKAGDIIDPEEILLGKQVTFMTIQEEKDGATFTRIVDGSLKPRVEENE